MHSISLLVLSVLIYCASSTNEIDELKDKVKPYPDKNSPNTDIDHKKNPNKFPHENKEDSKDTNRPITDEDEESTTSDKDSKEKAGDKNKNKSHRVVVNDRKMTKKYGKKNKNKSKHRSKLGSKNL